MTAVKLSGDALPSWPRLLDRNFAAAYLGIGPGTLIKLPIQALRIGNRLVWDRRSLDAYVDRLAATEPAAAIPDANALLDKLAANDQQRKTRPKRQNRAPG